MLADVSRRLLGTGTQARDGNDWSRIEREGTRRLSKGGVNPIPIKYMGFSLTFFGKESSSWSPPALFPTPPFSSVSIRVCLEFEITCQGRVEKAPLDGTVVRKAERE